MKALFKSPIFWLVVIVAVAVAGYYWWTGGAGTGETEAVGLTGGPDVTDPQSGSQKVDVGFAAEIPSGIDEQQSLPTQFRPGFKTDTNTIK